MKGTWKRIWQVTLVLLATAALGVADSANMPPPGTLNYVEGQVSVQGQKQTPKSVGSTYLESNQELDTGNGNAEMLLTPGAYLRIGHNSEVKMISPGLADTQVQLMKGSAMLEVDELFKENNMSVVVDGATTRVEKQGLYDFNTNPASVKVLDGKAVTYEGDQHVNLKKGHEALLAEAQPLAGQKFDKSEVEDDPMYRWSDLRSEYATNSNVEQANALMAEGGWWGPGWYWDPFWWDFAFMPGWGMGMMWGPFGRPFFSPWAVGWAPYYGFGYGGRYYHYPVALGAGNRAAAALPPLAHQPAKGSPGFRALPRTMAMNRGGMRGMPMGRMGGFQGAGVGGGFHGGFGGRR